MPTIALGCMRLSTIKRPDRARGVATIHAALDAGVRLLDTADAYALDDSEIGHNERLIAEALASWEGPAEEVLVATKGGLTRPKGIWLPDGRAKHLISAAQASALALGVEQIGLYQLHAVDPRTKFSTSVRALAKLHKAGTIKAAGLSNVRVHEIREAQKLVPIASIQVAISPFVPTSLRNGVAQYALEQGMLLLAYSPLGSPRDRKKLGKHPVLKQIAADHGVSVQQVALAWIRSLSSKIVPLVGSTRPETIRDSVASLQLELTDTEHSALDQAFPAGRVLRVPIETRRPSKPVGDVVLLMGSPASGKSSLAKAYTDRGYARLNRDEEGGAIRALVPKLDQLLIDGHKEVVLDNTYPDRASRNQVIEMAWSHGVGVRCDWLQTTEIDASVNASQRMVQRHGAMLGPAEIKASTYANTFGPSALMRYRRTLEVPLEEEGFALKALPFERSEPDGDGAAVLVHADVIWSSASGAKRPSSAADLVIDMARIARLVADERQVVVLHRDGDRSPEEVDGMFALLADALPTVHTAWCGHASGAPVCWCRKPYPGLAVQVCAELGLDPRRCLMVGTGRSDPKVAAAMGMPFEEAAAYF